MFNSSAHRYYKHSYYVYYSWFIIFTSESFLIEVSIVIIDSCTVPIAAQLTVVAHFNYY